MSALFTHILPMYTQSCEIRNIGFEVEGLKLNPKIRNALEARIYTCDNYWTSNYDGVRNTL